MKNYMLLSTLFLLVSTVTFTKEEVYNPCFFDYAQFVNSSEMGKEMRSKLEKMETDFHAKAMQEEEKLKKLVEEYKSKAPLLSQSARASEENKIKEVEEQYRNMIRRMQQELSVLAEELGREIATLLESELKEFAQKNGYTVVFDIATGRIVYCQEALNKTDDIVALVNAKTEQYKKEALAKDTKEKTKVA
jgi:Skp family chaperone for outer membrane proteins